MYRRCLKTKKIILKKNTALLEREERRKRLRNERSDDRPEHKSRQPVHDQFFPSKHYKSYDKSKLPPGWLGCPAFGQEINCIVPSKVPLGEAYNDCIPPGERYSFKQVIHRQRVSGRKLGLVIDLTNTTRYYSTVDLKKEAIKHVKIYCKGRDAVPENAAVNTFVYEVMQFLSRQKHTKKYILVHCTHGHNRTGYMIVHYLMRSQPMSVTQAIKIFAEARPPGIYKPDYIDALYSFYHEIKPDMFVCPPTPEWKRSSEFDLNGEAGSHEMDVIMTNDDVLGDEIPNDQMDELRQFCYQTLKLNGRGNSQFPGSHPVSLSRDNLQLLRQRYYYATWKADGTRYMMLIMVDGCFLIDRNFKFRRVQMRFPWRYTNEGPADKIHHFTLLDGEMIIDTMPDSQKQERRYLIYDMMAVNQVSVIERPFHERWKLLEKEVIEPRNSERQYIYTSRNSYYRYDLEPFRVRRKDFWLLSTVTKVLKEFIPRLSHDADGLIFQGWDDPYVTRTHEGLLKWKYPEMNSVDFLFEVDGDDRQLLYLHERGKKKLMEGHRVSFKGALDPSSYSGKIVECSWDSEEREWVCMRVRTDKSTPNDFNTYKKVMRSINDNITEDVLLHEIDEIIQLPMYADRIRIESKAQQHANAARRNGLIYHKPHRANPNQGRVQGFSIPHFRILLNPEIVYSVKNQEHNPMEPSALTVLLICLLLLTSSIHGEESNKNRFRDREATDDALGYPHLDEDALLNTQCPRNLELRWQTEVSSSVYASPLIADINRFRWRQNARRVKKNWYVGLDLDPVDRSHPDVDDDQLIMEASEKKSESHTTGSIHQNAPETDSLISTSTENSHPANASSGTEKKMNENQSEPIIELPLHVDNSSLGAGNGTDKAESGTNIAHNGTNMVDKGTNNAENGTSTGRRLLEDDNSKGSQEAGSESKENDHENVRAATVENGEGLEADADSSFELFRDSDELNDDYSYDYDDDIDESMWGDEEWIEGQHEKLEDYVNIDSHILCTPVIADIDNDGVAEMIVAVSYFFDNEYYDNPEHLKELGDIDVGKYVASSIVVFNLDTKLVKWTQELDLSTNTAKFRAYIYSSPSVVDLDGDGNLDILVGTSYGLFYVLDHHGNIREKFPLEMAEIQGAVVAADINDDGKIELVTTDAHGNVAAWTSQGKEIWVRHLKSLISQGPTIGDVDGDGRTDIVVPTLSGNIYVLSGNDGSIVRPYPYRTHGKVMNQVLLVDLSKRGERSKGLTLVTTSFDGYLYLIDGPTSCADVVDIGETSYSMVLADNVDGGDDLDLIVSTMNGNAWRSSNQGRNNMANRYNREGVYITPSSRSFRDEEGKSFWVEFEIVDKYRFPSGSQAPYNVTTTLLVPGNYQGERRIKQSQTFDRPGKYRIKLPTVGVRTTGTVLVEMVDKNGLYFSDDFSLTFHMHYYKLLKWLLVLPMLGMFCVLVILRPQEVMPLPSFSRDTDL
ncbi:hypothetical protein SADUNF_Sadunf06G0075200 [Salix dunnii]|uniref:mRNA guanylyltransferase n=1 Tax=Salix dunnii TaxID=1413687 RepID=A0A835K3J3_9ROSI|nr:hypothetical protein SADUNF_Sadunf06G0075200 [Salix dunnii]